MDYQTVRAFIRHQMEREERELQAERVKAGCTGTIFHQALGALSAYQQVLCLIDSKHDEHKTDLHKLKPLARKLMHECV